MALSSPTSIDPGTGGGSITDLTAPAPIDPQVETSGTTSLGSTAIGSWSSSVTVTATGTDEAGSAAPTMTVSGSGAGPYSVSIASGLADGKGYRYRLRGDDGAGQVADTFVSVFVAAASGGGASLEENIDTTGLSGYNFTTTGGTGGTGGEGNHDLGTPGGDWVVSFEGTSGAAQLEVISGEIEYTATASDYTWLHIPLVSEAPNSTIYVTVEWTTIDAVAAANELFIKLGFGGNANAAGEVRARNSSTTGMLMESVNGTSSFETAFSAAGLTMTAGQTVRAHFAFQGGAIRGFFDQTAGQVAWPADPSSYSTHTRTGAYDAPTHLTVLCSRANHKLKVWVDTDTPSA